MDAPDGQVPGPRRPRSPQLRAVPTGDPQSPRVPELHALLGEIDALRLTLQTDLSLAAAALEAGADELAAELVDGDIGELRRFATSAGERLSRLEPAAPGGDEVAPVSSPRRRRILSGAPLMAAAAALIGFVAFVPGRGDVSPQTTMTSATMAGYELSRLALEGAPDEQIRLAAEELNDELAQLIAQAGDDPVAAQQAMILLEKTTAVLSSQGNSGLLRGVMAETAALRAKLRETLPVVAQRPSRPGRAPIRAVVPLVPRVQEQQPEKERAASEPSAAPKASAKPSPSPSPSSPSPSPSPEPQPSQQPSSSPSGEADGGPLPQNPGGEDGIPGV